MMQPALVPVDSATRRAARELAVALTHPAAVYIASLAAGSRRTQIQCLRRMCRFFAVSPAAFEWHTITFGQVAALRSFLAENTAPATANVTLAALRGVLRYAVKLGQMTRDAMLSAIDVDPVRGSRIPAGRSLSRDELERLFAACEQRGVAGVRDSAIVSLLYGAGLRRAEVVALDREDVTDELGTLEIVVRRGKGNKGRRVPLPKRSIERLGAWLAHRGDDAGPLFTCRPDSKALSTLRLGIQGVHELISTLAERADLDHFTCHDLRRSYAGDLLDQGVDLPTVQALMGHSNVSTTARYDRRGRRAMAAAAARLDVP